MNLSCRHMRFGVKRGAHFVNMKALILSVAPNQSEQTLQLTWKVCFEPQLRAGPGMVESQLGGVQKLPLESCHRTSNCSVDNRLITSAAINFVADDGVL